MGLLYKARFYLIGNLEGISDKDATSWRDYVKEQTKDLGIVCMSPLDRIFSNFKRECQGFKQELFQMIESGKDEEVYLEMRDIVRRDMRLVDNAAALICNFDSRIPTFGTTDEISLAVSQNKPVLISNLAGKNKIPLWYRGRVKPSNYFNNIDEIISYIRKLDSGEIEMNPKYWRLFAEEYK